MIATTPAAGFLRLLLIDAATAALLFALVWRICVRVGNYGFLDATWTFGIGLLATIDAIAGTGNAARRAAFTVVGLAWSLRLGVFILKRVLRHHPTEDKRYRSLRERWPSPGAFLAFFELQALIAVVFSAPFLFAAFAGNPRMRGAEWFGLALAVVGIIGEAAADGQAESFKRRPRAQTTVLDTGLWRYSRHPNYFFEWLVWLGLAIAAFPLPLGGFAIVCPVLIAYFLLRVTGIPLTEKHSLETHGEAYREYQRMTSAFIPWVRRR